SLEEVPLAHGQAELLPVPARDDQPDAVRGVRSAGPRRPGPRSSVGPTRSGPATSPGGRWARRSESGARVAYDARRAANAAFAAASSSSAVPCNPATSLRRMPAAAGSLSAAALIRTL